MPLEFARRLTGSRRTAQADRQLGFGLAFVAGAINAGGFLAVQQYTSHMTGIVSAMADNLALGAYDLVLVGAGGLLSFLAGAVCSTVMVHAARRRQLNSEYAFPLLLEALLLLGFGVLGARLAEMRGLFVPVTVMLLCFIMGLQNAVITKLSGAVIRTTHITGVVTDIGIGIGRLLCRSEQFNRLHLSTLIRLALAFFVGGVWVRWDSIRWAMSRPCLWQSCWSGWRACRRWTICSAWRGAGAPNCGCGGRASSRFPLPGAGPCDGRCAGPCDVPSAGQSAGPSVGHSAGPLADLLASPLASPLSGSLSGPLFGSLSGPSSINFAFALFLFVFLLVRALSNRLAMGGG